MSKDEADVGPQLNKPLLDVIERYAVRLPGDVPGPSKEQLSLAT